MLKDSIVQRLKGFYMRGFNENGYKYDPRYKSEILARNKSPIYASLDWLRDHNVVSEKDILTFNVVKEYRNTLAHEILSFLESKELFDDFEKRFVMLIELLYKIEVWWIYNVEIATDPDFDGKEIDEKEIVPGQNLIIKLLLEIGLGDKTTSESYYKEFKKYMK